MNVLNKNQSIKSDQDRNRNSDILVKRVEKLKQAFRQYDKNLDDYIDFKELLDFLDSIMKDGKKFDRNLAIDIFKILDLNDDKKVTVEEFLKTFKGIFEAINNQIQELETALVIEQRTKKELELSVRDYINEPINEQQLSPYAKFSLEIIDMELVKQVFKYNGIRIAVRYGQQEKYTKLISSKGDLIWRQKFDL